MPSFRFRAAAALEVRQMQEQAAATALARAETAFQQAEAHLSAAGTDRRHAQIVALADERQGTDSHTILWHRNWIVHLSNAIELRTRELEASREAVRTAEARWREARKRRLALERMKDRAWRRHVRAEQLEERKAIDELARLRFIASGEATRGGRDEA